MTNRAAGAAGGLAAAVPAALFVATAGTALHRQGLVLAGMDVPWGAIAALALLGSAQLWLGAFFRSILPSALCGVLCYAITGWWSAAENGKRLVIADIPGNLWIFGSAAVTLAMLAWCRRYRPASA